MSRRAHSKQNTLVTAALSGWYRRRLRRNPLVPVGVLDSTGTRDSAPERSYKTRRPGSGLSHPARSLSPVELTHACLERIGRLDHNSFITVTTERALADARQAEAEVASGHWRGPLHGIPIALKDNVDTAGIRTTAASAVFADRVPTEDAEVVPRLKAAGAVLIGKLNMHEFALGTTSAISHFGPVHNPWDVERIAAGSSGGTAAAVAAQCCFGAVGPDTGGSNRIAAACCGIVGLKPRYGVVSTRGIVPVG